MAADSGTTWERLRTEALGCTKCPLAAGRTQVVFGVGDPGANLLFVGEGPGHQEDLEGEPFVGRSGKLLDRLMLEEIGITRAECYIANVVKCRPPQNRDPAPGEIEACRPYLEEQITLISPSVVITLGNFATRLLLDRPEGIRQLRGRVYPFRTGHLVPTYHPGVRPTRRRRSPGRNARRPGPGQAAHERLMGWPVVIETRSPAGTKEAAARLARICAPGDAILLIGDLGAGKTAFAQGFAAALGVEGPVTSPTFALVRQYRCHGAGAVETLIHADVYRTGTVGEVIELALAELVEEGAIALIEWGDLAAHALGDDALDVTLTQPDSAALSHRSLSISGRGRWAGRSDEVARALSAASAGTAS